MKNWKFAGAGVLLVISIICVMIVVISRNVSKETSTSKEGVEVEMDAQENHQWEENSEIIEGEMEDDTGEELENEETESELTENTKSKNSLKLKEQMPHQGVLSEKAENKLVRSTINQKSIIIRECQDISTPQKMRKYEIEKITINSQESKEKLNGLIYLAVQENPIGKKYNPMWVKDNYYDEMLEKKADGEEVQLPSSPEEPYVAYTPEDGKSFALEKDYYDTSVTFDQVFKLTQKRAVKKTTGFLTELMTEFSLGCEPAKKKEWKIRHSESQVEVEDLLKGTYENDVEEYFYDMTVPCTVDGYLVVDGDYFEMRYSESGWCDMKCYFSQRYKPTKKYYEKFLSLEQVEQKLLKHFKTKEKTKAYCMGITDAQLGYKVVNDKELCPVWIVYGERKGRREGSGTGYYALDAQTGKVLKEEFQ